MRGMCRTKHAFTYGGNPFLWGGGGRELRVLVVLKNCTVLIRGWENYSLEEFGEIYLSLDRQVCLFRVKCA